MPEVLLRNNARALWLGMVPPALATMIGAALIGLYLTNGQQGWLWAAVVLLGLGGPLLALFAWQLTQPRLAYDQGWLLVYLRFGPPIQLPIHVAECFLMGSGPSQLPGARNQSQQTRNLVIRLAESAPEWSRQQVKPALGAWCEGYITFRGAWCEPLDLGVVQRLNLRLAEIRAKAAARVQP